MSKARAGDGDFAPTQSQASHAEAALDSYGEARHNPGVPIPHLFVSLADLRPAHSAKKFVTVVLALCVAVSSGCGKSDRGSPAAGGSPDPKHAGTRIVDLPAGFPRDVPILKGATVKVAMSQGNRMVVHLYTSSQVAEAAKFYNEALQGQGWKIESSTIASDMWTLSARKGTSTCGVTVSKEGRGTLVRLAVSEAGS
ncbi:MAG TPA: hypothetical protein VFJ24_12400 [Gaiellales bacterium]|nr:hypothetical protein [Gaiellales bacterium]